MSRKEVCGLYRASMATVNTTWMINKIKNKLKNAPILKRIASGAFWSIFGTASAKLIVLSAGIVCANILGKQGYGELGIVRSTINLFVVLGTVGLGITATKFISQYKNVDNRKVENIVNITTLFTFCSAVIITLLLFIFADYIATNTLSAPNLKNAIRFSSLLLFTTIMNGVFNGILAGYEKFKNIAINTFISSAIEGVLIIIGAYYWGVNGAIVGFGIGISSLMLFNSMKARSIFKKNGISLNILKIKKKDLSILYKFSIPAALSSFLVAPAYWVVRTILVRHNGFGELGIFEAADQWRIIILFIPSALSNIILPILSSLTNTDKNDYKKALYINLGLNVSIAFVLATSVSLAGKYIMGAYGDGFNETLPLVIIAFSTVFSSFASVVGVSIVSRGKMWTSLMFNFLWSIMFISMTYIFVSNGKGALGISLALLLSYVLHSLFQSIYLFNLLRKIN